MLASVLMGKEDDFKGILAFYEHFTNSSGLMSWSISEEGFYQKIMVGKYDTGSATDGDLDAAYALLLAGKPKCCSSLTILADTKPIGQPGHLRQ